MEADEDSCPLLLRTRALRSTSSGIGSGKFYSKGWAATHSVVPFALSRSSTPSPAVEKPCSCRCLSPPVDVDGLTFAAGTQAPHAAWKKRSCSACGGSSASLEEKPAAPSAGQHRKSLARLDGGGSPAPPKISGSSTSNGSSEHDDAIVGLLQQQRIELNELFSEWVDRLSEVRASQEQRQGEFIERALAACAAGYAANGPLLWPGSRAGTLTPPQILPSTAAPPNPPPTDEIQLLVCNTVVRPSTPAPALQLQARQPPASTPTANDGFHSPSSGGMGINNRSLPYGSARQMETSAAQSFSSVVPATSSTKGVAFPDETRDSAHLPLASSATAFADASSFAALTQQPARTGMAEVYRFSLHEAPEQVEDDEVEVPGSVNGQVELQMSRVSTPKSWKCHVDGQDSATDKSSADNNDDTADLEKNHRRVSVISGGSKSSSGSQSSVEDFCSGTQRAAEEMTPSPRQQESSNTMFPDIDEPVADRKSVKGKERRTVLDTEIPNGEDTSEDNKYAHDNMPGTLGVVQLKLRRFTKSLPFTLICSFGILANAAYIGWNEELQLQLALQKKGDPHFTTSTDHAEISFCIFFTAEMCLRLAAEPVTFVLGTDNKWNFFDVLLIVNCITEVALSGAGGIPNLTIVRIMRICRMFKILRIIRVMRFFRTLRLMVSSIVASMVSLLWVFMLLLFAIYVWSIVFLHAVFEYAQDVNAGSAEASEAVLLELANEFGTVRQSLITLFMAVSGGRDWSEVFNPLMDLDQWYGLIFLFYIFFVVFGMLNVVTSAFVDILQQVSRRDRESVIEEEMKRASQYVEGVKQIFLEADTDNSATLSWEELVAHMQDERMQAYLSSLELDASQARALFVLLDVDESGEVCVEEFVKGCMRLKGAARSMDVNMLLYENEKILYQFSAFKEYAEEKFDFICHLLEHPTSRRKEDRRDRDTFGRDTERKMSGASQGCASKSRLEASVELFARLKPEKPRETTSEPKNPSDNGEGPKKRKTSGTRRSLSTELSRTDEDSVRSTRSSRR